MSSEDPERVELSLRVAESLVRRNVFAAREVRWDFFWVSAIFFTLQFMYVCHFQISVQMTKVLLHMEDKHSINGFRNLRQSTMVALTVTDCIPVRF